MSEPFTCAYCRGTYPEKAPDEVMMAEYESIFGSPEGVKTAVVCDPFWQRMKSVGLFAEPMVH